jgi:hypothetical protein
MNCRDPRLVTSNHNATLTAFLEKYSMYFIVNQSTALVCMDDNSHDLAERFATLVGQLVSIVSLAVTLLVFMALTSLRTVPGRSVMCLCSALLVAQTLLQFGSVVAEHEALCIVIAALTHFAWLASFSWMAALAFDTYWTMSVPVLISHLARERRFRSYLGLCWGGPALLIAGCLLVGLTQPELMAYTDGVYCWITGMRSLLVVFAVPVAIVLLLNGVLFVLTLRAIRRSIKAAKGARDASQVSSELWIYVRLASLMGFTWLFGLLQNAVAQKAMGRLFSAASSLQGVYILTAFVGKWRIVKQLRERICGIFDKSSAAETGRANP